MYCLEYIQLYVAIHISVYQYRCNICDYIYTPVCECICVGLCYGVQNDYPFPYKISIEVASADQSSIDAIRRVGGEVRVVYRHPINLRAHIKPYKFDVLPKTVNMPFI